MLGVTDLRQVISRLMGSNSLSETEMQHLVENILEEADLDDDGALSFAEFEHIIDKSSDFSAYVINSSIVYSLHNDKHIDQSDLLLVFIIN